MIDRRVAIVRALLLASLGVLGFLLCTTTGTLTSPPRDFGDADAALGVQNRQIVVEKNRQLRSNNNNDVESSTRSLNIMEHDDNLMPLSCNTAAVPSIDSTECISSAVSLSSLVATAPANGEVTIPCGACATVDYTDGSTITIPGGLNVLGRLHFPSTANVVINTTAVIVQGMLDMTIPNSGNQVKVTLYGTEEQYLFPYDKCNCSPTGGGCAPDCMHKKSIGKKPIAIAGGRLLFVCLVCQSKAGR